MGYLAQATLDEIQADPSRCEHYYLLCKRTFLIDLGSAYVGVPDNILRFMWCAMVAHHLKPYGASSAYTLEECLSATHLDCDNYAALTVRLYELVPLNNAEHIMLGVKGGAVGNHAQLIVHSGGWAVLCDPTVCVFAKTTYDDLMRGIPALGVKAFYWQWSDPGIQTFLGKVTTALRNGAYRPKDLLYYFKYVDGPKLTRSAQWATPQAPAIV